MFLLEDLNYVISEVNKFFENNEFIQAINNLSPNRVSQLNSRPRTAETINKLRNLIRPFSTINWTSEQENMFKKLGFQFILGPSGFKQLTDIANKISTTPINAQLDLTAFHVTVTNLMSSASDFKKLLTPFASEVLGLVNNDEGILEVEFSGGVSIDNFSAAKQQMADWFLIIEGYARTLGVSRDEFEIVSISKSSPAKFKIKTAAKNIGIIVGVLASLLALEKSFLENQMLLEQLSKAKVVNDSTYQAEFLEKAKKDFDERLNNQVDMIVDATLKKYHTGKDIGDVRPSLSAGLHNQYKFINKGGNVNIYITNGEFKQEINAIEKAKEDVKLIKSVNENRKLITEPSEKNKSDEEQEN